MLRSNAQGNRTRGQQTIVDGRSIPYTRSGRVFGMPDATQGDQRFIGEALFHASGHNSQQPYTWTVPDSSNIDYISVVCVGGGGSGEMQHDGASGAGGALAYKNDIPVAPGAQVEVYVGGGGRNPNGSFNNTQYNGDPSYIRIAGQNYAVAGGGTGGQSLPSSWNNVAGGTWDPTNADGGGNGGAGTDTSGTRMGGGGAGGYSGNGGGAGPADGYPIPGFPGTPQPGNGGGGSGGNSRNSSDGTGGGGGTGVYGEGSSGTGGSPNQWYNNYGKGGSTAYNTGLNGYIAYPGPINNVPGVNPNGPGYWGTGPSPNPTIYVLTRTDGGTTQYNGNGGFCGGGGAGGHSSSHAGSGGHGMVRIVYGYNGPIIPANKREFPTTSVDRSDQYVNNTNPQNITIDDINGVQLMY